MNLHRSRPSNRLPSRDAHPRGQIEGPPPVVVGCGPAGLFAAWRLVEAGLTPIVIERGPDVTERTKRWNRFLRGDVFDPESNLLFGEGGAGAYSDGKLYTRVRDPRVHEVLEVLASCGAPRSILYDAKPHIGSNLLPSVVRRMRRALAERGADFRFSTRMTGLIMDDDRIRGIELAQGGALDATTVFLGLGHSARETIRELYRDGVAMERKPFQIGARIEHPQRVINRMQYGSLLRSPIPAARRLPAGGQAPRRRSLQFLHVPRRRNPAGHRETGLYLRQRRITARTSRPFCQLRLCDHPRARSLPGRWAARRNGAPGRHRVTSRRPR